MYLKISLNELSGCRKMANKNVRQRISIEFKQASAFHMRLCSAMSVNGQCERLMALSAKSVNCAYEFK